MNEAQKKAVLSLVRSTLLVLAGVAVAHGYLTDAAANEVVSSIVILAAAAWGAVDKLKG